MVNAIHMRWCTYLMYNTRRQVDSIINRLIWKNEKSNIVWLCILYSNLSSSRSSLTLSFVWGKDSLQGHRITQYETYNGLSSHYML